MPQAQQQQNDQMKLPIQTRSAELGASKQEARTVDMVCSTGARVRRYDWYREREYWEELSLDDGAVRLGRLNDEVLRQPLS